MQKWSNYWPPARGPATPPANADLPAFRRPLPARPVLATLAIFTFVAHWNDFLWPLLVLNKPRLYTMPVGVSIIMYQIKGAGPTYGISMSAAILMSVLPIVAFLLMQRQMIQGITIGSLKG